MFKCNIAIHFERERGSRIHHDWEIRGVWLVGMLRGETEIAPAGDALSIFEDAYTSRIGQMFEHSLKRNSRFAFGLDAYSIRPE